MFKKRLKGLLAMVLAGSIAASAVPLTASARITNATVNVYDGDNKKQVNYLSLQDDDLVSHYLTPDNLWGVYYSYNYIDSGCTPPKEFSATGTEAFSGDKLLEKIEGFEDDYRNFYSDIRITAQHKYIVTTDDPSVMEISGKSAQTTSTFPVEIPLTNYDFANPLMEYSCTPWYSTTDVYGQIYTRYAVKSTDEPVRFSAGDESISIGMDTFKGLYSADIHTGNQNDAIEIFLNGITILQLKAEYKTLSLPVKNALLRQETDSDGADRHISVSKDSESPLDEGDYYFYLCYYDEVQKSFKISNSAMKYEKDVWDEINTWVTADPNLDTNNLFLCRKVTVNVNGNGVDTDFNTKDLLDYLIVNQGKYTTNQALLALFTAKPNSIWEVNPRFTENPSFYTYQKDAATSISDFLLEYPHEKRLNLFEQSSIRVTALDPKTSGEIEWGSFIESKLLDENGEPRKISDYFNDLFAAVPQEAGKKYDTDGWQLWAGVTSCGGLYDFSKVELDKKPDSIGVTELNKMQNSIAFVYFPQVEIAPSLEVTAPVAGETPSTEYKILDTVGGYSVDGVEWDCDYTLLLENDKFEAGKKYRVKIDLLPDGNLSFVNSTPVTINGKEAFETILDDACFSVYQVFTTAPEKPQNVKATAGNGKVDLSWEASEGAFYYSVYLYNEDGTLRQIATIEDLNDLSYTVENLANGTEYGFLIRAVSEAGVESSYTAEDVVYATPAVPVAGPTNIKATAGDKQVKLTWDKVTGATKYKVVAYNSAGAVVYSSTVTGTTETVTGLESGTKYGFLVRALVNGAWVDGEMVYATTTGVDKPVVTATPGDGRVRISWTSVTGATKYKYFVYDNTDTVFFSAAITDTATTVAAIKNLTPGMKYGFLVRALVNGAWVDSDIVYATPTGVVKPVVTATPGDSRVRISWTGVPGATKYKYFVYDNTDTVFFSATITDTATTAAAIKNLVPGVKYGFLVRALVNGAWVDSDIVYAIPTGTARPIVKATPGDGRVRISWTGVPGATKYKYFVYDDTDTVIFSAAISDTATTAAAIKNLTNGRKYGFFVRALVNGAWVDSEIVYATPNA